MFILVGILTLLAAAHVRPQTSRANHSTLPELKPSSTDSQSPVFKSAVTVVEVDATVTDRSGRTVTGLQPQDFEIQEDGRQVRIVSFASIAGGRDAVGRADATEAASSETAHRFIVLLLDDM